MSTWNEDVLTALAALNTLLTADAAHALPDPANIKSTGFTVGTGVTELIAAPGAGSQIRVWAIAHSAADVVEVVYQDDAGTPVVMAGPFTHSNSTGVVIAPAVPCFTCADNTALDINVSAAVQVGGLIVYEIV